MKDGEAVNMFGGQVRKEGSVSVPIVVQCT